MAKQNAINLDVTPESDGFKIAGGTTSREIKISGGNVELQGSGSAEISIPISSGSDEFVLKTYAQTLTNKRINPRIVSATSYTTDTGTSLNVDNCDQFVITAQAGALKFNNPGGTPLNGQKLVIRIKDSGTARALTYDTQFRGIGVELPNTTVAGKTLYMGFIYNSNDTKWDLVASAQEE